jgi:hypothetical protein
MAEASDAFDLGGYCMLRCDRWTKAASTRSGAIRKLHMQFQCCFERTVLRLFCTILFGYQ